MISLASDSRRPSPRSDDIAVDAVLGALLSQAIHGFGFDGKRGTKKDEVFERGGGRTDRRSIIFTDFLGQAAVRGVVTW